MVFALPADKDCTFLTQLAWVCVITDNIVPHFKTMIVVLKTDLNQQYLGLCNEFSEQIYISTMHFKTLVYFVSCMGDL